MQREQSVNGNQQAEKFSDMFVSEHNMIPFENECCCIKFVCVYLLFIRTWHQTLRPTACSRLCSSVTRASARRASCNDSATTISRRRSAQRLASTFRWKTCKSIVELLLCKCGTRPVKRDLDRWRSNFSEKPTASFACMTWRQSNRSRTFEIG